MKRLIIFIITMVLVAAMILPACAAPAPAPAPAPAHEKIALKASHPWANTHRNGVALDYFAEKVEELSDGDITIDVVHGGAIVTGRTEIDCLRNRIVDVATVTSVYHAGVLPEFFRVAVYLPFAYDYEEYCWLWQNTNWFSGTLKELGFHTLYFAAGSVDVLLKEPVDDVAHPDLSGRTIRASGLQGGKIVEAWGADVVTMPSAEVPMALATGLANGVITTTDTWYAIGVMQDVPYIYRMGAPFATMHCMTQQRWSELPAWAQEILTEAAADTQDYILDWLEGYEADIVAKAEATPGVHVYQLTPEQLEGWREGLAPMFEWFEEEYGNLAKLFLEDCARARQATK